MRFLCDVHIPRSLSKQLSKAGHDSMHVNRLPDRWHSKDREIARFADQEDRILISKDSDFRDSCIVQGTPRKLIKVNLGNIPYTLLTSLFLDNLDRIARLNERPRFLLEVDRGRLSVIDI
jgi:predicted nuclease of predicted toxin-antitoxin system